MIERRVSTVRDTGNVVVTEWNPVVEDRTVVCNHTSRDWSYCAVNALAEFQNSPWGQNRLARRLNTNPSNRVEFQAEAYNDASAGIIHTDIAPGRGATQHQMGQARMAPYGWERIT